MKLIKAFFATFVIINTVSLLLTCKVLAAEYDIPEGKQRLIGQLQYHQVEKGDFFQRIAEQYNVGFLALLAANPSIDPFLPEVGTQVVIPSAMLLPFIKREGIVVNLPELRLYYFEPDKNKVHVFPVGIGRQGLATPKATSYISEKRKDPVWRPTKAMKERYLKEKGVVLANEVPPGANNPFGKYALRLGTSEYLIHGTNKRFGIGMRASSGCIRMYDDDIKWLYDNVALQTRVRIIDQPIKMSYENGQKQLIEIHEPLTEEPGKQTIKLANAVQRFVGSNRNYWHQLVPVIEKPTGLVIELEEDEQDEGKTH